MNAGMTSGANMTMIGVTTVFVALTLLVAAISLLRRILDPPVAVAAPAAVTAVPGEAASADPPDELVLVALAAYAYHLQTRVSVPPARATSAWLRAGRQQQMQRRRGR